MLKNSLYILFLVFSFGQLTAQNSKDYQPNLPDYSNKSSSISPVPTAPPPPPNPIPIDGGTGFLIVAGLGYGLRKIRKQENKND